MSCVPPVCLSATSGDMTAVQIKMTLILMLLFMLRDILVVLWLSLAEAPAPDVSGLISCWSPTSQWAPCSGAWR